MEKHKSIRQAVDFLEIQGYKPIAGKPCHFFKCKKRAVIVISPRAKIFVAYH